MAGKVLLDSNVFIDYLREGRHADWVLGRVEGTVRFLSAVVLFELRLGADTLRRRRAVERVKAAYPETRIVAPSAEVHDEAGVLFRRMYGSPTGDRLAHVNDLLIALTARAIGATVVTGNAADFGRLTRVVKGLSWRRPEA